jgi:cytochrome c6
MTFVQRGAVWLWAALAATAAHADVEEGRRLFTSVTPACSVCHALRDAGAEGAVGPSLDELKPDHERVVKALRTGIGQMPAFTHLSEAQIQALARYVSAAAK